MRRYCLIRICGNDLPPRHAIGQTEANLQWILDNEPTFDDCDKVFLFNRIIDADSESRMRKMLRGYGFETLGFPFEVPRLRNFTNDTLKLNYLTNVNQARNFAIQWGLEQGYEYVLPFDGACMFRRDGWESFDSIVRGNAQAGYFIVPMWRLLTYDASINDAIIPSIREVYYVGDQQIAGMVEPQIVFTRESDCHFNERLIYGDADKLELLYRLDIPGVWDRWYETLRRQARTRASKFASCVKYAGFVCRLPSGKPDQDNRVRGAAREVGLNLLLRRADEVVKNWYENRT